MRKLIVGVNDLATKHPELLKEWNYEKNGDLLPTQVICGSKKRVWWKCSKGHEWQVAISTRTIDGNGCPICVNQQVLVGYNDLATTNPKLLEEWDYEKNNKLGIHPNEVTCGSGKKVWWKCSKGHTWQDAVYHRNEGRKCPFCSMNRVWTGFNDLATLRPDLANEWSYKKNGNFLPSMVLCSYSKKVWWKCKTCGHEWNISVRNRSHDGTGCPKCNGIYNTSFGEQSIFYYLKLYFKDKEEVLNRYQMRDNDGIYELDIFIPSLALAIEYDGCRWHRDTVDNDLKKNDRLYKLGIRLIRIKETDENKVVDDVIYYNFNKNRLVNLSWALNALFELLDLNCDSINVVKDRLSILECYHKVELDKSLLVVNPQLAKEWNYEKNGRLRPEHFRPSSCQKVWWKCEKGHEWQARIADRNNGHGCPICSNNRVLTGYNDLASCYPHIAEEWDYEKNGDLLPTNVLYGSHKRVWWKCKEGHSWNVSVIGRTNRNRGCPVCGWLKGAKLRSLPKEGQSLQDRFPKLLDEWDFEKNDKLGVFPNKVKCTSNKKVYWKCSVCGHIWMSSIYSRSNNGTGCPVCCNHQILIGYNDLQTTHPLLVKEWNYEKNNSLLPTMFTYGSNKKVWWKCSTCGYEWQAVVSNRTALGRGCPKCALKSIGLKNSIPKEGHSLKDNFPNLVKEWNYEKNGDLLPSLVTCSSGKKVWWKCNKCGHEWQTVISNRTRGNGCPKCAKKKNNKSVSSIRNSDSLNGNIENLNQQKGVLLQCLICGNEWQIPASQHNRNSVCPVCSHMG